jgi:hypothetical protein
MDRNSVIALFLLYGSGKRRRNRLHWVHPVIRNREEFGAFYTLFGELRDDANRFSNYFLMSVSSFDSGVPRNVFRGVSTNSVEDRGQRERGSGGGSLLVRGSAQFANG